MCKFNCYQLIYFDKIFSIYFDRRGRLGIRLWERKRTVLDKGKIFEFEKLGKHEDNIAGKEYQGNYKIQIERVNPLSKVLGILLLDFHVKYI